MKNNYIDNLFTQKEIKLCVLCAYVVQNNRL